MVFSDSLLSFLLERLNIKDNKIRLGTLAIIRHLITHIQKQMEDKKGVLVSGIKPLVLSETSLTVSFFDKLRKQSTEQISDQTRVVTDCHCYGRSWIFVVGRRG